MIFKYRFIVLFLILALFPALMPSHLSRAAAPGALDTSFGSGGVVATPFSYPLSRTTVAGVAVQPDGKIVVAASVRSNTPFFQVFGLARYNTDGTFDNSFGPTGNGTVTAGIGSYQYASWKSYDNAIALTIQSDGRIIVLGTAIQGTSYVIALARYTTSGILDTSFHGNGTVMTLFYNNANGFSVGGIAIQKDGKILVAGSQYGGSFEGFTLMRLNTDGSVDTGFGSTGTVATQIGAYGATGTYSTARAVVIQPDGKIVLAGYAEEGNNQNLALARYNGFGNLDSSFNGNGTADLPVFTPSQMSPNIYLWANPSSLALRSDGSIIVSGRAYIDAPSLFIQSNFVACFAVAGTLNTNFGSGGIETLGSVQNLANNVVIQSDNKIVVGYSGDLSGGTGFFLTRLTSNGTTDTGFGTAGTADAPTGGATALANAITNQTDGKVIVAGTGTIGTASGVVMERFIAADTTAPNWSSTSALVASNITQTSLVLVWTQASDDVGVASYRIYQGSTLLATVPPSTTSFTVTGLSSGTSYQFKVQAGDAAGLWTTNGPSLTVATASGSLLGSALPFVLLAAVIAGFAAAFLLTKPKQPKTG